MNLFVVVFVKMYFLCEKKKKKIISCCENINIRTIMLSDLLTCAAFMSCGIEVRDGKACHLPLR